VAGDRRQEYFSGLRRTFRKIHASFQKLKTNELIPLPDHPEIVMDYHELIGLEVMGEQYVAVGKLRKRYNVRDLLNGVVSEAERLDDLPDDVAGKTKKPYHERGNVSNFTVNIGNNAQFSGDFAVGEKIRDSFNKVQYSTVREELRELLKQLAEEVANVAGNLDKEASEELADDLDRFTSEVIRDKPKPKWYEPSYEGIKEACQSVGQAGMTALILLDKVFPMLK